MNSNTKLLALTCCLLLFSIPALAATIGKLPAEKAGEIGSPTGKIAFIRSGDVWIMNANGADQEKITEVTNADGRLSWSPDGKTIAFTRSGLVDLQGPDLLGGKHKVYDIFLAFVDSAYVNNRQWWYRITDDLGSRDPQWLLDGRILYWKDLHANTVNAFTPNYQVCTMDKEGMNIEILRKDWQNSYEEFLISPSMNSAGDLAVVDMFNQKSQGFAILKKSEYMLSMDTIKIRALDNQNMVAPAWSPDGKWVAYVSNNLNQPGLFITDSDNSQRYLVAQPPVGSYINTVAPSFSHDSKWVTYSTTDGSIWICDITGKGARRLTPSGLDKFPAWWQTPLKQSK
ncbi:MAG: hypothetical protein ACE5FH_07110 [Candidatus Zixiibacteriota bacterium]